MRRWLSLMPLMFTGLLLSQAQAAPTAVVGTAAAIEVPPGFSQLVPFELRNPLTHSIISVTEFPQPSPFPLLRAQMNDKQRLKKRGVKVLRSEKVEVSGHEGQLQLERRGRGPDAVEAWRLGVGDMLQSMTIEGIYPVGAPAAVSDELRKAVLSVVWHVEQADSKFEGLHFRIKEGEFMKIAEHNPNGLLLRPDEAPLPDPAPVLVMGEMAMAGGPIEEAARQLLQKTREMTDIGHVHGEHFKVARLDAYEITATGRRSGDNLAERIYDLVIYDPSQQRAYVAVGVVGEASAKRYMHEFQDVARSLTPKP